MTVEYDMFGSGVEEFWVLVRVIESVKYCSELKSKYLCMRICLFDICMYIYYINVYLCRVNVHINCDIVF